MLELLRPLWLLRPALVMLRLSLVDERVTFGRTLGATMTSASGAIFANADVDGAGGVSDVIIMFAVEVGDRWRVRGWAVSAWPGGVE